MIRQTMPFVAFKSHLYVAVAGYIPLFVTTTVELTELVNDLHGIPEQNGEKIAKISRVRQKLSGCDKPVQL